MIYRKYYESEDSVLSLTKISRLSEFPNHIKYSALAFGRARGRGEELSVKKEKEAGATIRELVRMSFRAFPRVVSCILRPVRISFLKNSFFIFFTH